LGEKRGEIPTSAVIFIAYFSTLSDSDVWMKIVDLGVPMMLFRFLSTKAQCHRLGKRSDDWQKVNAVSCPWKRPNRCEEFDQMVVQMPSKRVFDPIIDYRST
jgi:hypothetical protein